MDNSGFSGELFALFQGTKARLLYGPFEDDDEAQELIAKLNAKGMNVKSWVTNGDEELEQVRSR